MYNVCMGAGMRIVIVEDEIRIREGIANLLHKLGNEYVVLGEASDGDEGLDMCLRENPDLVITDIRMPHMDGITMLEEMYKQGLKTKAIVLSAYSEFEYARGAMRLGVTEYLLKPVSLMDFSNALNNIRVQLEEEQLKKPHNIGTLEQTLTDLYYGSVKMDDEIEAYLSEKYGIDSGKQFCVIGAYLGRLYENVEKYKTILRNVFAENKDIESILIESPFRKAIVIIVYKYKTPLEVERWLQYRMLQDDIAGVVFGFVIAENIAAIKSSYDCLSQYMDWNISFEKEILISYPKITNVQTSICTYPMDAEAQLKLALCSADKEKVERALKNFHSSFLDGKIYAPREIKDCYVRFLWFAMEIARDLGNVDARKIERQDLLKRIMDANSKSELTSLSSEILDIISNVREVKEDVTDLTVKRAKSIIHEYYNTGITLDEIANKLNITPEYLGTKFRTETGVTFSTYMKDYRITKAKELLMGTNLKLYEIADRVGYNDPKYFSRVFKEETGQLPADYRKTK